jgi:hypothetical protein
VSGDARHVLDALVAARNAGSAERAAGVLRDDVRYWDPHHGDLRGRDAVAGALTAPAARLETETVAASGDDAVIEVRVREGDRDYRSTEVYRLEAGEVASIRAYFDPTARAR